jgi:hypothetical protein
MGRLLGFVFWSLLILGSDFGVTVCIVFLILLWSIAVKDLGVFLRLVCCWNLLLGSIDVQCLYTKLSVSRYTVVPGLKAEMNAVTEVCRLFHGDGTKEETKDWWDYARSIGENCAA